MKACKENHEPSTGLYYGSLPRSVCTGKFRQNTVQLWLDSSTRHNAKDMVCNQRLVQTNLACVSQGNGQPLVPLLPASASYRGQQSNVEHYRQNHNFQNSIRDKGNTNSTSLVESKHSEKEWVWYLQGSERNMNINWNKRFAEIISEINRKQKKYFQGQENVSPNQLSSQGIQCTSLLEAYDSLTSDSPSRSLSQGGFANKSQSLKNGQSNSPHSMFKSSQASSSLHRSMLSLDDSLCKARPISNKSADICVTQNPLNYLNLPLGNERAECSVNMYPDKCKAQGISKIPACDGSLLHSGSLLNDSHPLLHVREQHLNTKNLTCICNIHENADSGIINSESDVCKDDCHRTSHFIISGRKTLKMSGTLTLPNKDMNNSHDSHYAVCQKSAGILCHLPTKSDCMTEMETNQRVPEDREQSGTEDMFSNAVEIRKELSEKSPDNFLDPSLKYQVKSHFPIIMNNTYRAAYDLCILESTQTPVYEDLPLTPLQSNSSQDNFYRYTQKEILNLKSTEVGKRAMGNSPISDYFRNSTPSRGEENNKGENDLNTKQKDNSTLYNREHDPILKEFLKGNVETKQLLQTFPLMDSNMLKIMKLRGYSLNDRTKTPVESYLKSYHERLLSRCLCAWHNSTQQRYASAISLQKRQLLRKGLQALHWAVQFTQMQKQFLERIQYRRVLAHCFNQWRCAANASQCHLTTRAPNAVSKSCSVRLGTLATLQQILGTNIYRYWQKQCKHLQHEDVQSPSLSGLHSKSGNNGYSSPYCTQIISAFSNAAMLDVDGQNEHYSVSHAFHSHVLKSKEIPEGCLDVCLDLISHIHFSIFDSLDFQRSGITLWITKGYWPWNIDIQLSNTQQESSILNERGTVHWLQAEGAVTKYMWQAGQVHSVRDCFEAQAQFFAQDCASQHTLFRNHAKILESCFLHWRTLLHIKRGKRVAILHPLQLCNTELQQQTTAVSCQNYGKDNDHNKNEKYEMSLQLDDVHITHEELHSYGGVCLEQSSQPQFQDSREELHKLQIAKYDLDVGDKDINGGNGMITSWNQLQDVLKLWPEEFFKPCLQEFSKYQPLQDSTVALGDEEFDCSSLEQSALQYGAGPANRPGLERAGKWLQGKLEKRLVEEHLMLWAARVRQVDQFHRRTLLTRVLLSWSKWRQTRQRRRELVAGFSFGRQRRVVLTLWKIRLLQKHEADRRCGKVLCQKTREAMSQWHQYTEKRKQVQDLQAHFLSVHALRVKLLTLQAWKQKAETQRNVKIMADMQVQRRYLRAWHCAALQKEKMWQKLWTFQTVRNQQVLLGAFSQWRYHLELQHFSESHRKFRTAQRVIQCWRQRTLLQQAVRHRATILIQTLFSRWKEAIRLSQLSHQIADNIKMRQLRLLLLAWAKLVKERKDESVRQKKVISASQHQVKQTAFCQMATLYRKQKEAVLFYHLTLLRRCLLTWVGNVHLQKHWALTVSAQASLLQLNSAFAIWRTQLHFQRKMALFVQGQTKQILHKALKTWYSELQALRYRARYVSQKFVSRWIVLVKARKQRGAEESRAEEHHRNQSCKLFLKNWQNQTFLQQFLEKKRVEKLQEIWKQWNSFTMNKLVTRGLYEKRLEVKAWQLWRRRFIQMQVSQAFAAQDSRILMLDVFTTWYRLAFGKQN